MGNPEDISPAATAANTADEEIFKTEAAVKAVKAGNADDVDIAAQVIANYADEMGDGTWTKEEEKRLMRKVDWWLIPIVRRFSLLTVLA
jgi:MFS transporter, ACS family, allantoate permease